MKAFLQWRSFRKCSSFPPPLIFITFTHLLKVLRVFGKTVKCASCIMLPQINLNLSLNETTDISTRHINMILSYTFRSVDQFAICVVQFFSVRAQLWPQCRIAESATNIYELWGQKGWQIFTFNNLLPPTLCILSFSLSWLLEIFAQFAKVSFLQINARALLSMG